MAVKKKNVSKVKSSNKGNSMIDSYDFVIEKGIPLPSKASPVLAKWPQFREMEVGAMFFVPGEDDDPVVKAVKYATTRANAIFKGEKFFRCLQFTHKHKGKLTRGYGVWCQPPKQGK